MKLTIELETDDLNILKLIAKAAYVKPALSQQERNAARPDVRKLAAELRAV